MRAALAASFLALAALLAWWVLEIGRPASIVLVTVDTLRADHLGVYGYPRPTTPNLDAFAREALVFERAQSHGSDTRTSVASLLTGYLPHETRVIDRFPLPAGIETVAETLSGAGYATLAVIGNYILKADEPPREAGGWSQGFDVYDDEMEQREVVRHWPERTATSTVDRALDLLGEERRRPVFLWVHFQDPHGPYTPPPRLVQHFRSEGRPPRTLRANPGLSGSGGIPAHQRVGPSLDFNVYVDRYDAEIRFFDEEFGRLLAAVDEALHDPWVVFSSDHGEGLGEHDFYFSHIGFLHQSLTHVPLIVRAPAGAAGRRDAWVQHIDVVPTLLGAAGVAPDSRLRGRDLLDGEAREQPIHAATRSPIDRDGSKASVVLGGFKLIRNLVSGQRELYDLRRDPGEELDLSADPAHRKRLDLLDAELARERRDDRLGLPRPTRRPVVDADEERKLRALGYVE